MPQGGKTRPPHERETVQRAYALRDEGQSNRAISRTLGVHQDTVARWLDNPSKYDPYLDEVAIRRARAGDMPVYDALTVWEREEVYALLATEREKLMGLFKGNQHMEQPDANLWRRFGSAEIRVRDAVMTWREKMKSRDRRAAA